MKKKKSPVAPFFSHPAASPETIIFYGQPDARATYLVPAVDVTDVDDYVDLRGPRAELLLPRVESGQRHNDEERSVNLV